MSSSEFRVGKRFEDEPEVKERSGYWTERYLTDLKNASPGLQITQAILIVAHESGRNMAIYEHVATRDALTRALSRPAFDHWFNSATRNGSLMRGLIMLEVDNFKQINDTEGHMLGDHVLRTVVNTCYGVGRRFLNKKIEEIRVCRWGGDEFIIGILAANINSVLLVAEYSGSTLSAHLPRLAKLKKLKTVTVRMGAGLIDKNSTDLDKAVDYVDGLQYKAREFGGSCLVFQYRSGHNELIKFL